MKLLVSNTRVFRESQVFLLGRAFSRWFCWIQSLPSFTSMTTLCGFGTKVSLRFVKVVKSVVIRWQIASLMENVGGVAP